MRVINRYYTHKQVLFNKRINDKFRTAGTGVVQVLVRGKT